MHGRGFLGEEGDTSLLMQSRSGAKVYEGVLMRDQVCGTRTRPPATAGLHAGCFPPWLDSSWRRVHVWRRTGRKAVADTDGADVPRSIPGVRFLGATPIAPRTFPCLLWPALFLPFNLTCHDSSVQATSVLQYGTLSPPKPVHGLPRPSLTLLLSTCTPHLHACLPHPSCRFSRKTTTTGRRPTALGDRSWR